MNLPHRKATGSAFERPGSTLVAAAILLLAVVVFAVPASSIMNGTFMFYDDEGYVLFSLKNFAEHGGLYRDVYTQYGPLPYALYYLLHLAGMPFTHFAGRAVTLIEWSGCAFASALLVWRATRNLLAAVATLAGVFVYLWRIINEPTHPGGLAALICAIIALVGWDALNSGRNGKFAAVAGAGIAALTLTKINLGVFAAFSAVALALTHATPPRLRRVALATVAIGVVALPLGLMRPLLAEAWVQTFAIAFVVAGLSLVVTAARIGPPPESGDLRRNATIVLLAMATVIVLVLGIVMPRGTSFSELMHGILLAPLRHPTTFSMPYSWPAATLPFAFAAMVGALLCAYGRRRGFERNVEAAISAFRILAAIWLTFALTRFPSQDPIAYIFPCSISLLWIFGWHSAGEADHRAHAKSWLVWLTLGQWLHAFPVPVSQADWGSFLVLPLSAIAAVEAGRKLQAQVRWRFTSLLAPVAALLVVIITGIRFINLGRQLGESRPLRLAGAEGLTLPDQATFAYRIIVANAAAHADVLFSLPGMFSLNLWSGVPAPTLANTTHWFSLLDPSRQRAIQQALEAHPNACVVVQTRHVDFLYKRGILPRGELYRYIQENYEPAFRIDDFEFRVRKGRQIAPLFVAEILERNDGSARDETLLRVPVLLLPGETIHSISIATQFTDERPRVLDNASARIEVTPIDLSGNARGSPRPAAFPLTADRPLMLSAYYDRHGATYSLARTQIVLRDRSGGELAVIRLQP